MELNEIRDFVWKTNSKLDLEHPSTQNQIAEQKLSSATEDLKK